MKGSPKATIRKTSPNAIVSVNGEQDTLTFHGYRIRQSQYDVSEPSAYLSDRDVSISESGDGVYDTSLLPDLNLCA